MQLLLAMNSICIISRPLRTSHSGETDDESPAVAPACPHPMGPLVLDGKDIYRALPPPTTRGSQGKSTVPTTKGSQGEWPQDRYRYGRGPVVFHGPPASPPSSSDDATGPPSSTPTYTAVRRADNILPQRPGVSVVIGRDGGGGCVCAHARPDAAALTRARRGRFTVRPAHLRDFDSDHGPDGELLIDNEAVRSGTSKFKRTNAPSPACAVARDSTTPCAGDTSYCELSSTPCLCHLSRQRGTRQTFGGGVRAVTGVCYLFRSLDQAWKDESENGW
ncbi:hypothetical protein CDD83_848 [Cordyceps sp. RAO-2017]|nr:hypothetical protein CDD83_848 [Cordyceps sp. RAO-2017]